VRLLTPAVGERPDPILESPAKRFLISKLGCNLPIRYSFSTITHDGLCIRSFTFDRIIDDRFIRNRCPAIWAYNLVFHLLTFPGNVEMIHFLCVCGGQMCCPPQTHKRLGTTEDHTSIVQNRPIYVPIRIYKIPNKFA